MARGVGRGSCAGRFAEPVIGHRIIGEDLAAVVAGRAIDAHGSPGDRHGLADLELLLTGRGCFLQELDGAGGRSGRVAVEPLVHAAPVRGGLAHVGRCGVA